jgi:hypothetical protein
MANTLTTYYAQTSAIDELVDTFGPQLQGIEYQDKLFMIQALAALVQYRWEYEDADSAMEDLLDMLDPDDDVAPAPIKEALYSLCEEPERDLLGLIEALVNQLKVSARPR